MDHDIAVFLAAHGWADASHASFAADWSARRYMRLTRGAASAIVMQDNPDSAAHFAHIAGILRGLGASAPEIYAIDAAQGFLLLEDFGDRNFGRMIDGGAEALPLLLRGAEALGEVQTRFRDANDASLPHFDAARFIELLSPLIENVPHANPGAACAALAEAWRPALDAACAMPQSLLLRDYIPDNLMDLPGREGWRSSGFLDFDLAGVGPVAYDLASLVENVRRDVPDGMRAQVYDAYLARFPAANEAAFRTGINILGAQRYARTYARLIKMDKPAFTARARDGLRRLLALPELAGPRRWFEDYLPDVFEGESRKGNEAPVPRNDMPHTAMVLAAGYGKRMMPLTMHTPKPLLKVGGKTMLDHALDRLRAAGVAKIVVNAGYLGDRIAAHLASRDPAILVSCEAEPLETGGGVKHALSHLGDDPIFIVNADLPWREGAVPAFENMRRHWDAARMDILLLVMPLKDAHGFDGVAGDYDLLPDGKLARLNRPKPFNHVYIGAQIVKPRLYRGVAAEIFSNNILFDEAEKSGRLYGCVHDGGCYHVGTPEDLRRANEWMAAAP